MADIYKRKCPSRSCRESQVGYYKSFDKSIDISDHTSTLANVRVSSRILETMLGCSVKI
jgi:hypothetical protein